MKKIFLITLAVLMIAATIMALTSCNRTFIDTTYSFERAVISLPNGEVVEGNVDQWADFENSDMIQVKINGKVYLTHISNVVLISE